MKKGKKPEKVETAEEEEGRLHKTYGTPRKYQERVFDVAKMENIIAVGPTGCGKTFIGVMLAKYIFERISSIKDKESDEVRMFFIVNKVILVHQQFRYFEEYFKFHKVPISINKYWGAQRGVDMWRKRNWRYELDKHQMFFMTAQIALNILSHGLLGMEDIDLIIFDECHHCLKNSPYQRIMRDFYYPAHRNDSPVPKIFGMTASPFSVGISDVNRPFKEQKDEIYLFQKKLRRIQNNLDSVVYMLGRRKQISDEPFKGNVEDINIEPSYEMKKYLAEPKIYSQEYSTEFDVEYHKYLFIMNEFNRVYTENGKEYVCHVINDCMNILYELGSWAVYRYLLQIRLMTKRAGQVRHAFLGIEKREHAETIIHVIDQLMFRISGHNNKKKDDEDLEDEKEEKEEKKKEEELTNQKIKKKEENEEDKKINSNGLTLTYISDVPQPNQMSNKVNTLLQIIEKYKQTHPNFCALIFVRERKTAWIITEIIKSVSILDVRCACLMGHGVGQRLLENANPTAHQKHHSARQRRVRTERIRIKEPYVFGQTSQHQQRIMSKFGKSIDVVVTTSVAEEGIDIQACHCVIRFNMFNDLRGYIQSKGRARKKNSDFVVLYNKSDEQQSNLIENIKSSENNLIRTCLISTRERNLRKRNTKIIHHQTKRINKRRKNRNDDEEEEEEEQYEEESLRIESTGARCSLSDALSKLHQYCSLLPFDKYASIKSPSFSFKTVLLDNNEIHKKNILDDNDNDDNYEEDRRRIRNRRRKEADYYEICSITLPPNATLNKPISGQPCLDKSYAKKSAALEVIKVLYSHGFLDDHLLPSHEYNVKAVKEEYRKQLRDQAKQRHKKKNDNDDNDNQQTKDIKNNDEFNITDRYTYEAIQNEVFRSSSHLSYNWIDEIRKRYHCFVYAFLVKNEDNNSTEEVMDQYSIYGQRKRDFLEYETQFGRNRRRKRRFYNRNRKNDDDDISKIKYSEKLKDGEYFPFGFVTSTKLPSSIPPIDIFLENETNSDCTRLKVTCQGQITISKKHMELMIRFHHLLNSVILRKTFTGFKKKNYLLFPIHRTTGMIDWNLMVSCIHQGIFQKSKKKKKKKKIKKDIDDDELSEKEDLKESKIEEKEEEEEYKFSTLKDKFQVLKKGDLIFSLLRRQLYIVSGISKNKPTDLFPYSLKSKSSSSRRRRKRNYKNKKSPKKKKEEEKEEEKLTFRKYFEQEYSDYFSDPNIEIDDSLPLIEVIIPPAPSNVLFNRHLYHHSSSFHPSNKRFFMLSDHCLRIPLPKLHFNLALKISGVFWFLENFLLLSDLNESLQIPLDLKHLREAMTASSTSEKFNYERLEFFGDRILKIVTSMDLFFRYPDYHEGILHSKRYVVTSNIYLKDRNLERKIYRFAFTKIFSPRLWCPPGYELLDGKEDKRPSRLPRKLLADLIESLSACAYLSGGIEYSRYFLIELGFPFKYNATTDYIPVKINCAEELYQKHKIGRLEKLLGYKFRFKTLLVQAVSHQSFRFKDIRCYQRLEFLGDAILDFIVTEYFFGKYRKATAENLHDLRGLAVSNEFFAMICVTERIYEFLLYDSEGMKYAIEEYIIVLNDTRRRRKEVEKSQKRRKNRLFRNNKNVTKKKKEEEEEEREGEEEEKEEKEKEDEDENRRYYEKYFDFEVITESPKFLADMFESLCGAIYIDSNCSMERVKNVIMKILEPYLEIFVTMRRLRKSPMRELTELLQDYQIHDFQFVMDHGRYDDGGKKSICTFVCEGRTMGSGEGRTGRSARKRCGENILDLVEKNPEFLEFRAIPALRKTVVDIGREKKSGQKEKKEVGEDV